MTHAGTLPGDMFMPPLLLGPRTFFARLVNRIARRAIALSPPPPPLDPHEWNRIDEQRSGAQSRKFRAQHIDRRSLQVEAEVRARLNAPTGNYLEGVVFGQDRHSERRRPR